MKVNLSIRVEEEEKQAIQDYAKQNDLTTSQVVRKAIKLLLDNKEE